MAAGSRAPLLLIATPAAVLALAGCSSGGLSAVGKKEIHNCRIATLGTPVEKTLRGAIEPDLTDHSGNVVPTTVDTYVTGGKHDVELIYQDRRPFEDGVLVGRDCGTGHVHWWSRLRGVAKLEAERAS